MPELIIKRAKEFTFGMVGIQIYLNNDKIGQLNSGDFKKWSIEQGKHTLYAKGGLILKTQKIEFMVQGNDRIALKIESFGKGYTKSFLQFKKLKLKP